MPGRSNWAAAGLLLLLALQLGDAVHSRSALYDEGIMLLETSGHARPEWPREPVPASELKRLFDDRADVVALSHQALLSVHPPGYALAALSWRTLFGGDLVTLRTLSALLLLLQAALLWRYLAPLPRRWAGLGLFCLSGLAVFYGALARNYAAATLLALAAMMATSSETRWRRTTPLWCAAALMTHYFTVFSVIGLGALWALRAWRRRDRGDWATAGLIAAAVLATTPLLGRLSRIRPGHLNGFSGWFDELGALGDALVAGLFPYRSSLPGPLGWLAVGLVAAALAAGAVRWVRGGDTRLGAALAALVAHLGGMFAMAAVFDRTLTTAETVRYVGLALPAVAIVAAYGLDAAPRRWALGGAAALLALQAAQLRYGQDSPGVTARQIARDVRPGQTVVAAAGFGRGVPAALALELAPDVEICVLLDDTSCLDRLDGSLFVHSLEEAGSPNRVTEEAFKRACGRCDVRQLSLDNMP